MPTDQPNVSFEPSAQPAGTVWTPPPPPPQAQAQAYISIPLPAGATSQLTGNLPQPDHQLMPPVDYQPAPGNPQAYQPAPAPAAPAYQPAQQPPPPAYDPNMPHMPTSYQAPVPPSARHARINDNLHVIIIVASVVVGVVLASLGAMVLTNMP